MLWLLESLVFCMMVLWFFGVVGIFTSRAACIKGHVRPSACNAFSQRSETKRLKPCIGIGTGSKTDLEYGKGKKGSGLSL